MDLTSGHIGVKRTSHRVLARGGGGGARKAVRDPIIQHCRACREDEEKQKSDFREKSDRALKKGGGGGGPLLKLNLTKKFGIFLFRVRFTWE